MRNYTLPSLRTQAWEWHRIPPALKLLSQVPDEKLYAELKHPDAAIQIMRNALAADGSAAK